MIEDEKKSLVNLISITLQSIIIIFPSYLCFIYLIYRIFLSKLLALKNNLVIIKYDIMNTFQKYSYYNLYSIVTRVQIE